jgi:hypothetical protein
VATVFATNYLPRPIAPRRLGLLWVVAALAGGCGGSRVPLGEVEGTASWNGRPLANMAVEFIPDADKGTSGPRSTAVTDANGRFVLQCEDQRPGAVIGYHRVVLRETGRAAAGARRDPRRRREREAATNAGAAADDPPRLPLKYHSGVNTPLLKKVGPGQQRIDLTLTDRTS